jgi:hypothetical protein
LVEPRVLDAVVEDEEGVAMEDVSGPELGDHEEQAELGRDSGDLGQAEEQGGEGGVEAWVGEG